MALDPFGTKVVAHRSTKRLAQAYIDRFEDCLGEQNWWTGSTFIPIRVEWVIVKAAQGGFLVVSDITPREEVR